MRQWWHRTANCSRMLVLAGCVLLQAGAALAAGDTVTPPATAQMPPAAIPAIPAIPTAGPAGTPAIPAPATAAAPPVTDSVAAATLPATAALPSTPAATLPNTFPQRAMPAAAAPVPNAAATAVSSASSLTQVALVLVLVVALIAGMAWLLRRLGVTRNGAGNTIRVVSGLTLSNRERILVLEIADQWIVVGVSPGGINTLTTLTRQEQPATAGMTQPAPAGNNFALWLKQTMDKRNPDRIKNTNANGSNGKANGN